MIDKSSFVMSSQWLYCPERKQFCFVLEVQEAWDTVSYRVWFPDDDTVLQLPEAQLVPPERAEPLNVHELIYRATAARISEELTQDVCITPIESSLIPLPHQIYALTKAVSSHRVRYLLADEVGLGKTIEAGLIMKELKHRGVVHRTLVVVPRGLIMQWVSEMAFHFNEDFIPVLSGDYNVLKRISKFHRNMTEKSPSHRESRFNPFQLYDQVIVSMDSVKPPSANNEKAWERFEDLISAGWDLIIIDEAHRLGGSTDTVARYRLGKALSEAAPHILLLTATPHQGKTDQFRRLMSLLDAEAFPDNESVQKDRVQPYVIRTEKRRAITIKGEPLFKPRFTELVHIEWGPLHEKQRMLYEHVTDYVRRGYNRARQEKKHYIGFLMILMQRLVVSSTGAIRTTLEKRLEKLNESEQPHLFDFEFDDEDWLDLDSQELMDTFIRIRHEALYNEKQEVMFLLKKAKECENTEIDAKAEALLHWLYKLQVEEGDPELKVLVFTEFIATQEMLYEFLTQRGFEVVCINGKMGIEERKRAQDAFARHARILLSTDAGGEGLNLQFCHVVINYDMPWNPMRLEQRIGRVDRIGQKNPVRVLNFVLSDSVEHRVREVLEQKLERIFNEYGVDKTSDVLDSTYAEKIFDDLYINAIMEPEHIEENVQEMIEKLREQVFLSLRDISILGSTEKLDPDQLSQIISHPLPYWVERMTLNFLLARGGRVEKSEKKWNLQWPDGYKMSDVVFHAQDAEVDPSLHHLTLDEPRMRKLIQSFPRWVPGYSLPILRINTYRNAPPGYWSLWRISLKSEQWEKTRYFPLFISDDRRLLLPTARYIWDRLLTEEPVILTYMDTGKSLDIYFQIHKYAQSAGKSIYEDLKRTFHEFLEREKEKKEYSFRARLKAIQNIGLPEVRNYRLRRLQAEKEEFKKDFERKSRFSIEFIPILIVRVEGDSNGKLA